MITASPTLLIVGALLLTAAFFVPLSAERWANQAMRMLGSDLERFSWFVITNLWMIPPLIAFLHYRSVRHWLTASTTLQPPWRDYLAVFAIAAASLAVRWMWLVLLQRTLDEWLALRVIRRWRAMQPTMNDNAE